MTFTETRDEAWRLVSTAHGRETIHLRLSPRRNPEKDPSRPDLALAQSLCPFPPPLALRGGLAALSWGAGHR